MLEVKTSGRRCSDYFFPSWQHVVKQTVQITRYQRSEFNDLVNELDHRNRERLLKQQFPLAGSSPYRATSVTARSRLRPPDCGECGACCSFPLIVSIARGDEERLKEYWEVTSDDVTVERVLSRDMETGCCKHFEGIAGERSSCDIYHDRPTPCRIFEAGSDRCLEFRRMYGIDPQLTESELANDLAAVKTLGVGIITDAEIEVGSVRTSMRAANDGSGGMVFESTKVMKVSVALDKLRDEPIELFQYEAESVEWLESDFLGLTIDEAQQMVAEREVSKIL